MAGPDKRNGDSGKQYSMAAGLKSTRSIPTNHRRHTMLQIEVFTISSHIECEELLTVSVRNGNTLRAGGMAEWFKAAVLKTVVRKYRGFESYSLRHTTNAER